MPSKARETAGMYFLLLLIIALMLTILYALGSKMFGAAGSKVKEMFSGVKEEQLLDPNSLEIYQGIPIPDKYNPTPMDVSDPNNPAVDGTMSGPHAMYMFAYNRCSPECCKDSPYSCSGGCVCMTSPQYSYLDKRGNNRNPSTCGLEDSNQS